MNEYFNSYSTKEKKDFRVLHLLTRQRFSAPEKVAMDIKLFVGIVATVDIHFLLVGCSTFKNLLHIFKLFFLVRNYDIIHTHGFWPDLFSTLMAPRAKRITTLHVDPSLDLRNKTDSNFIFWAVFILWTRAFDRFKFSISVNNYIKEKYFSNLDSRRAVVIRNTVSLLSLSNQTFNAELSEGISAFASRHKFVICATAVLSKLKKIDFLIESMLLARKTLNIGVLIIGNGPEELRLKKMVAEFGLFENVYFCGNVASPYLYYEHVDAFYSGSISEGSSLALIEALACGVPVIASQIPANLEIFGEDSRLLFRTDDMDSFLSCIGYCAGNLQQLKSDSLELYHHHFSKEKFGLKHLDIYGSILNGVDQEV